MKKFIGFIVLVMTTCFQLRSQHTEGNPFARLGFYAFGEKTTSSLKDKQSRNNALGLMPLLRFYILTQPIKYGDKFPYKVNYTNEW